MDALIIGAGAQGRILLDILKAQSEYTSVEYIDDNPGLWGQTLNGVLVTSGIASLQQRNPGMFGVIVAMGNPIVRLKIARRLQKASVPFLSAIHPNATIMASARLGRGLMLHPGAVINSGTQVGDYVLINTGVVIEHDCRLEDGATICPGAQVGGRVHVKRGAFIGTGAIILPRCVIGERSVVAAGALVTQDVPAAVLVMGRPARKVEEVGPSFDWNRLL